MSDFKNCLVFTTLISVTFTGLFVAMWWAYFFDTMDTFGVVFISGVGVFMIPMLIGSILVICRRRVGLAFIKFGSLMLFFRPFEVIKIWRLDSDPECVEYLRHGELKRKKPSGSPESDQWFRSES
jgi:hypothetical protein